MSKPPSAWAIQKAVAAAQELIASEPDIVNDPALLVGTLEGETDAMDVLDRLLRAAITARRLAEDARKQRALIAERQAGFEAQDHKFTAMAQGIMELCSLRRHVRGDFTAFFSEPGPPAVQITDETAIPEELLRWKSEPKKDEIRALLAAGEDVPGAVLSNQRPKFTVKVT